MVDFTVQNNENWIWFLLRRVVSHALAGALATAIVGALCIGGAGALTGFIWDLSSKSAGWNDGFTLIGALIGVTWGSFSGIVGALICGWVGLSAPPSRAILPPRALLKPICAGQIAGTLLACATYFGGVAAVAWQNGETFGRVVESSFGYIMFGTPALMIIGAIVGGLLTDRHKRAA